MLDCNGSPSLSPPQGQYTKITFRSPLYLGGAPSAYWLVRATGSNRGFQGCIQSLTINNKATDLRPWPLGSALSGADIGKGGGSDPYTSGCPAGLYPLHSQWFLMFLCFSFKSYNRSLLPLVFVLALLTEFVTWSKSHEYSDVL